MLCPNCKSSITKCIDSRPINGRTRRRYECRTCYTRFSTAEISVEDYKALQFKEYLLCDALTYADKIKEKLKGNTKNENESNA